MSLPNDVKTADSSGNGGWRKTDVPSLFIDKTHLYNDVLETAAFGNAPIFDASYGPYFRNMVRRAKHAQKYTSYS